MNKEFVPYEEALALEELGFNEPCFGYYDKDNNLITLRDQDDNDEECLLISDVDEEWLSAPLYQQAFRWFREKYKLLGTPQYFTGGFYCYTINDMKDTKKSNRLFTEFESHEEAELECLLKLIEITKKT